MMAGVVQSGFIVVRLVFTGTASHSASLSTGTGVQSGLIVADRSLVKFMKNIGELALQC